MSNNLSVNCFLQYEFENLFVMIRNSIQEENDLNRKGI